MANQEGAAAWNRQAERAVIGGVLYDQAALDRVNLAPDDFFHPAHRETFAVCRRLRDESKPIDAITVGDELERAGKLAAVGGLSALTDLYTSRNVADAHAIEHWAAIVARDALTRRVRRALVDVLGADLEADELLGKAFAVLSELHAGRPGSVRTMRQLVLETVTELEDMYNGKIPPGIPTGLRDLDFYLGGLQRGVLTVIGGRPSQGKSSLARTIADNVSSAGGGVHVFSLEDPARPYCRRAIADNARLELQRIRTPKDWVRGDLAAIMAAGNRLQRDCWLVDDTAGLSAAAVAMSVRRHKREINTQLVVVDYVQLLRESGKDKRERIDAGIEGLVRLAREEGVALIAISQLNRDTAKENRRPQLNDLKESGTIEEAADAVLLVHRGEKDGKPDTGVSLAKNKHGRTAWVPLFWDGPTATYRDAERTGRTAAPDWREEAYS